MNVFIVLCLMLYAKIIFSHQYPQNSIGVTHDTGVTGASDVKQSVTGASDVKQK